MLNLKDIQKREVIKPGDWMSNKPLEIIITSTSPMTSNFLYQTMFLLENRKFGMQSVRIYILDDGSDVTKTDIQLGMYVDRDKGKNRADVLAKRYGGVFTTKIMTVTNVERLYSNMQDTQEKNTQKRERHQREFEDVTDKNTLVIGFGKTYSTSNDVFSRVLKIKSNKGVKGTLARIHGSSDEGKLSIVNTIFRKYGDVVGEQFPSDKETSRRRAQDIVQGNQMIAQTMVNFMNLLITEDEEMGGLPVLTWNFDTHTQEQKHTYCTDRITIFHKTQVYLKLSKFGVSKELLEQADEDLKTQIQENKKEFIDKLANHGERDYKTMVQQYKNNVISDLEMNNNNKKGKVFKSEEEQYYKMIILYELIKMDKGLHMMKETGMGDRLSELHYTLLKNVEEMNIKLL